MDQKEQTLDQALDINQAELEAQQKILADLAIQRAALNDRAKYSLLGDAERALKRTKIRPGDEVELSLKGSNIAVTMIAGQDSFGSIHLLPHTNAVVRAASTVYTRSNVLAYSYVRIRLSKSKAAVVAVVRAQTSSVIVAPHPRKPQSGETFEVEYSKIEQHYRTIGDAKADSTNSFEGCEIFSDDLANERPPTKKAWAAMWPPETSEKEDAAATDDSAGAGETSEKEAAAATDDSAGAGETSEEEEVEAPAE